MNDLSYEHAKERLESALRHYENHGIPTNPKDYADKEQAIERFAQFVRDEMAQSSSLGQKTNAFLLSVMRSAELHFRLRAKEVLATNTGADMREVGTSEGWEDAADWCKSVKFASHQFLYDEALKAGLEPPMNLICEQNTGIHVYQRSDGKFYHWPEETLF